jgi:hypothetical protein
VIASADDCASVGLECRAATCVCATPTDSIRVDATATPGPLAPTGADAPLQCRFTKLGDALAYAKDVWMPAQDGAPVTVRALGTPTPGNPVVFDEESLPLVVAPGVTLSTTAASPNPSDWVISANPGASVDVIRLSDGGTVEGFTVRSVSATGNGITLNCGSSTPAVVRDVIVDGNATLARGISVSGSCGAVLERVDASNATGAALEIAASASASVIARGSKFRASSVGIQTTGGILLLERDGTTATEVTDNVGNGIVLSGTTEIDATLANVLVEQNGGTGLFVNMIPDTSKLTMTSCDVRSNGTLTPIAYGTLGDVRNAGGVLLRQAGLAAFQLRGNRIYANHGGTGADGLAFFSTGTWQLTTGSCEAPNAFGCEGAGRAVNVTTGGSVDATGSLWSVIPPPVPSTVLWDPPCPGTAPACP